MKKKRISHERLISRISLVGMLTSTLKIILSSSLKPFSIQTFFHLALSFVDLFDAFSYTIL